jgi:hypothetical protein
MPLRILIGIPVHGGAIKTGCVNSLLQMQKHFAEQSITADFRALGSSDVTVARNYFGTLMLGEAYSHLLFVDSDMAFPPAVIQRLIDANKPLIGCAAPHRSIDLPAALAFAKTKPPQQAIAMASRFGVDFLSNDLSITNDIGKVSAVGMAVTLISRDVFVAMANSKNVTSYTRHPYLGSGVDGPLYGFFDHIKDDDGTLLGEDFSFCHRWGGERFAAARSMPM